MNWLLFVLRIVFGWPSAEQRGPRSLGKMQGIGELQRIAVRPDGTTTTVPTEMVQFKNRDLRGDWRLLPDAWRHWFMTIPAVAEFHEYISRRKNSRPPADRQSRTRSRL